MQMDNKRKLCTSPERKIIGFNVGFSFSRLFVARERKTHVKRLQNGIKHPLTSGSDENIFICQVVAFGSK
jgi:hypothetical protein